MPTAPATRVLVAVAAGVLALSARAAGLASDLPGVVIVVDVGVGLVVVTLGLLATEPRVLAGWSALGLTWLLGSSVPVLANLHRGVLVVVVAVVVCGPASRDRAAWLSAIGLAAVLTLSLSPAVAAALLLAVAVLVGTRPGPLAGDGAGALLLVAGAEAVVALSLERGVPDPGAAQLVYPVAVLAAAAWTWAAVREQQRLLLGLAPSLDDLADDDPFVLLGKALTAALRDPSLRVTPAVGRCPVGGLTVTVQGDPWAYVTTTAEWPRDERTWRSVQAAVARVGSRERLLDQERLQATELAASRGRLLDAADLERSETGTALRHQVVQPLERIAAELASWPVIACEVQGAASDVEALLVGLAPEPLGDGALVGALRRLADRTPLPVALDVEPWTAASAVAEATAYAVCAEALTNVLKHADARRVVIRAAVTDGMMAVSVTDDGTGDQGPSGRGLHSLADRVAGRGGRLEVDSAPGRGTTVAAWLPVATPRTGPW